MMLCAAYRKVWKFFNVLGDSKKNEDLESNSKTEVNNWDTFSLYLMERFY